MLPKTCENFKQLSLGERVEKEHHQPPLNLTYKNSILHRVVKNGWVQGGGKFFEIYDKLPLK